MKNRYKTLGKKLGEGAYKTVIKALDTEEGKEVALNHFKLNAFEKEHSGSVICSKEVAVLKSINHEYLIQILDYWFTSEEFIFVTELMTGGTLKEFIKNTLSIKLIKKWGKQIIEGIDYLHSMDPPIIHRDIKTDNIFVNNSEGSIKIGDLGIAGEERHQRYTMIGTPCYMPREMFEGNGYTRKVDIYAFGMCLMEMATGESPYAGMEDLQDLVLMGKMPRIFNSIENPCLKSLILNCLVPESSRFSAKECISHHFFSDTECDGKCLPKECVTVYPLSSSNEMELSLISFIGEVISFQIHILPSRFIKFEYKLNEDTPELIANELEKESIIDVELRLMFIHVLSEGIEKAVDKRDRNMITNGVVILDPMEVSMIDHDRILRRNTFNTKTLEEMELIEEEIKLLELKERKRKGENAISGSIVSNNRGSAVGITGESNSESKNSATTDNLTNTSVDNTVSNVISTCDVSYTSIADDLTIEKFCYILAKESGRDDETALYWISVLKEQSIIRINELKILTLEDWNSLKLSIFCARIMKNCLGINPVKEDNLLFNESIPVFDNLNTKDFLNKILKMVDRTDLEKEYLKLFLKNDLRTVNEIKLLKDEDWDFLPILGKRIIKNVIFRRGSLN